jgi:hypothetical protein
MASSTNDRLLTPLRAQYSLPPWLESRVTYDFESRTIHGLDGEPFVELCCDVKTANEIKATCAELISFGIMLEGRTVARANPGSDNRLSRRLEYVGKVRKTVGERLFLDDARDSVESVSAHDVYLEPRRETFEWLVRGIAGKDANEVLHRLEQSAAAVTQGPGKLRRIEKLFEHLEKEQLRLTPTQPLKLSKLLRSGDRNSFPVHTIVPKPVLMFDPAGRRTNTWNELGLDKNGPYDQSYFTPKQPRIAVICEQVRKGEVELFFRKFLDGMPDVAAGKRRPFERGFTRRFMLERPIIKVFTASSLTAEDYRVASRACLDDSARSGDEWNLALIQIDEASRDQVGAGDPYLITKSIFMKRQVPVQEVTIEKMRSRPSDLAFILSDISLAAYAKLGGTPWLLAADSTIAHELIIGLGSYTVKRSRLGAGERFVGITTVFSGDGRYILENRTTAVPFDSYAEALLGSMREAILAVQREQGWRPSDSVRLIFHAFKPVKDAEASAVIALIQQIGYQDAEFAFIHVVDEHSHVVFDEANVGVPWQGSRKGAMAPERGTAVILGKDEVLVSLTGARELKQASDGMPRPVLLRLHRESTFKDITYLTRQVVAFASQSWRGFGLSAIPVTIQYSQLAARLLRKLQDVPDWDPEAMYGKIGRTRWFL